MEPDVRLEAPRTSKEALPVSAPSPCGVEGHLQNVLGWGGSFPKTKAATV